MKLNNSTLEVTRSGAFQEHGFQIVANAHAFDVLSSKMYTNTVRAIVRELSTNASDSHVEAGNPDKPFDVHLPNYLEPWFAIRDYGTGLSPEDVETIYTTYFHSTRNASNDFTGCLGLGSKSPFSYTDQFTVISNWKGRKYTYSAFKNESNCPTLALLSECETNDANGLEIKINVKSGDCHRFVQEAQFVYPFFDVRPNIVGANINFQKPVAILENDSFSLYGGSLSYGSSMSVVMGQVCYEIDHADIPNPFQHGVTLVLRMPIGSCSIAASREEVQYDQRTIAVLKSAVEAAKKFAMDEFERRVLNETSLWHKMRAMSQYRGILNGLSVQGQTHIPPSEKDKYHLKECFRKRGDKITIIDAFSDFRMSSYMQEAVFIESDVDLSQNMKNRLRQFIHSQASDVKVYLAEIKDAARFEELFGSVTTKLSLLPDVPRKPRDNSRANARSKSIKLMSEHNTSNLSYAWTNITNTSEVDATDACCVIRSGNWVMWNGVPTKPHEIYQIAKTLGFKRVYGITEKRYESIRNVCGLTDLASVSKDRTEQIVKGLDTYALSHFQSQHTNRISDKMLSKLAGLSTECDNLIKCMRSDIANMHMYSRLAMNLGVKWPKVPDYTQEFYNKYPILVAIDLYYGNIDASHVVNYIKLIEAN